MPQDERKVNVQSVIDESIAAGQRLPEVLRGRIEVKGITIDGPTSKDLDDAIFLEKRPEGEYIVHVTIADVASLVDSCITPEIDREAQERAFTRYFANSNKPMIPRPLSEDRLSLLEGLPRPTITVSIPLDTQFQAEEPTITFTCLTSSKRYSYDEVEQDLDTAKSEFAPMLQESLVVAQKLLKQRRARGAMAIYDINSGIATSEEGNLIHLEGTRHRAQLIIQEFMILANQTVATYLADRDIPALYRNHKTKSIAPQERAIMLQMIEDAVLHPERAEGIRQTINFNLQRARYAPTVEGHYGLNLPVYMHFTSPIRRYSDLVNHRILTAVLKAGNGPVTLPYTVEQLREIARHINAEADIIKDEKTIHFRAVAQKGQRRLSASFPPTPASSEPSLQGQLEGLSAKQYTELMRKAVERKELPTSLQQEALRRFENSTINPYDIFAILFLFPGQDLSGLKQSAINWLKDNAHNSLGILTMAQQVLGWEKPQYIESHVGSPNAGIHTVKVIVRTGDQEYPEVEASRSQKEPARQTAAVKALAQVAGVEMSENITAVHDSQPEPTRRDTPAHREVEISQIQRTAEDGVNYKNPLQELAQKNKWGDITYTTLSQIGESNTSEFVIEVKITINGQVFTSQGIGKNKKDAEQDAASKLLPQVEPLHTQVAKAEVIKSPLQRLNELLAQNILKTVKESFIKSGPDNNARFTFTYEVMTQDGRSFTVIGEGTRKIDAQQQAAQMVLDGISK